MGNITISSAQTPNSRNKVVPNGRIEQEYHKLIMAALAELGTTELDQESADPTDQNPIIRLHMASSTPSSWLRMLIAMIRLSPAGHPSVLQLIHHFMDNSKLPVSDIPTMTNSVLVQMFKDRKQSPNSKMLILFILSDLAFSYAGGISRSILTPSVLQILQEALVETSEEHLIIVQMAILAVERFLITADNKSIIRDRGIHTRLRQLCSKHIPDGLSIASEYKWVEIKFMAEWCLEASFGEPSLSLQESYPSVRCFLKRKVSPYPIKVSGDGLTVRNDSNKFVSCVFTRKISKGCWYYEVELFTRGIVQIGFVTESAKLDPDMGLGVGDDLFSIAIDGYRNCVWLDGAHPYNSPVKWKPGDIVGVYLDVDKRWICFFLNGVEMGDTMAISEFFFTECGAISPACSLSSLEHVRFNFGAEPFRFFPDCLQASTVRKFNDGLTKEEIVDLESLRKDLIVYRTSSTMAHSESNQRISSCEICFGNEAKLKLLPCNHEGFCFTCASKMKNCPLCRASIAGHETIKEM